MSNTALMTCAAILGLGFFTAAQAASSESGVTGDHSVLMAELETGKSSRVAVPVSRADTVDSLTTAPGDAHAPIARTKSGIRIIGVPFFPTDSQ